MTSAPLSSACSSSSLWSLLVSQEGKSHVSKREDDENTARRGLRALLARSNLREGGRGERSLVAAFSLRSLSEERASSCWLAHSVN